jgi:hypothetical protein
MLEAKWKTLKSSNLKRILRKKSRRVRSHKKTRRGRFMRKQRGGLPQIDSGAGETVPFGSSDVPRGFGGAKVGLSEEGVPVVTGLDQEAI